MQDSSGKLAAGITQPAIKDGLALMHILAS